MNKSVKVNKLLSSQIQKIKISKINFQTFKTYLGISVLLTFKVFK